MEDFKSNSPFSTYKREWRIRTLKTMHELVLMIDDEQYYHNDWIDLVPDEPSDEDFEYIADSKELYEEVVERFLAIMDFIS